MMYSFMEGKKNKLKEGKECKMEGKKEGQKAWLMDASVKIGNE